MHTMIGTAGIWNLFAVATKGEIFLITMSNIFVNFVLV